MARVVFLTASLALAVLAGGAEALLHKGQDGEGRWQAGPRLESARAGLAVAALEGRLYAAGGAGLTDPYDTVQVFDPLFGAWRDETPLPRGLERFDMAVAGGRLYAAGGYAAGEGARPVAMMFSYDPDIGVWQREAAMPGPRAGLTLLSDGEKLYALGGDGEAALYVFDAEAQQWSEREAPAESVRRGAAGAVLNGRFYLIGGVADGAAIDRVDIYDPQSDEWMQGAALPEPLAGAAAVALNGRLHVFGGRSQDLSSTLDSHYVLSGQGGEWSTGPALPEPRTEADAAVLDGRVYLVGGGAGGGFFAPFTALDLTDVYVEDDGA